MDKEEHLALAVLALAAKHMQWQPRGASAAFCIATAHAALQRGHYAAATRWALRSLRYSVGILHPAYSKARAAVYACTANE